MKISEMNNDQATEALLRLSTPFANICEDDDMKAIFEELEGMKGETVIKAIGKMLPRVISFGLRGHKNDIYEIVGALQMKPASAVGKMNFVQTVMVVRESYDDVLASFFPRSDTPTQKAEDE